MVDDTHINIWERPDARIGVNGVGNSNGNASPATASGYPAYSSNGAGYDPVEDTPTDPKAIQWVPSSVPAAGLAFRRPSGWVSSGILSTAAGGDAGTAASKRYTVTFTCDRRERCFRGLSICCVDVTALVDALAASATPPERSACLSIVLSFLLHRFRGETGTSAHAAPSTSEEAHRLWFPLLAQRWPRSGFSLAYSLNASSKTVDAGATIAAAGGITGSLGAALVDGGGSDVACPVQTRITDQRTVAASRLLQVVGWVGTLPSTVPASSGNAALEAAGNDFAAAVAPGANNRPPWQVGASSSPSTMSGSSSVQPKRSSFSETFNSASTVTAILDADADGIVITTTSAVLLGLHETGGRVFGHIITVSFTADQFSSNEKVAKAIFASLEVA
jgi:hypothetical protein